MKVTVLPWTPNRKFDGVDIGRPRAGEAIRLRMLAGDALDRDDMPVVRRLTQIADETYCKLSVPDALAYLDWARDDIPGVADLAGGGDA